MKVRVLWAAALVAASASMGCGDGGPCGGATCTSEQRCTPTQVCVTDNPPTVSIEAPGEGASVTAATVTVKGEANDDAAVTILNIAVDGAAPIDVPFPGSGKFSKDVPMPAKDSAPVVVTV